MLRADINYMTEIFDKICSTNSTVVKNIIVESIDPKMRDDFQIIVECLSGIRKFGYTWVDVDEYYGCANIDDWTIKQVIEYLLEPRAMRDLSTDNIYKHLSAVYEYSEFFEPIVNRELKLGIGKSLLPKDFFAPMLAKKFEPDKIKQSKYGYFITEKLDGNRCISYYDFDLCKWKFMSRNGKEMHVDFDMSNLPKQYIYDGEILSPAQVKMSEAIYQLVTTGNTFATKFDNEFSSTSGLINRHSTNKQLVYNIFDIIDDDADYIDRRCVLSSLNVIDLGTDVRILPVLEYSRDKDELCNDISQMLSSVTSMGGEGIMVNYGDAKYIQKRTDKLLKCKEVHSMDMVVVGIEEGTGKYAGMVGALQVHCKTEFGDVYCSVGSGLTDEERITWAMAPEFIIGRIVEVEYFSLSQSGKTSGSTTYSLRFPRLKKVRTDKDISSEY